MTRPTTQRATKARRTETRSFGTGHALPAVTISQCVRRLKNSARWPAISQIEDAESGHPKSLLEPPVLEAIRSVQPRDVAGLEIVWLKRHDPIAIAPVLAPDGGESLAYTTDCDRLLELDSDDRAGSNRAFCQRASQSSS